MGTDDKDLFVELKLTNQAELNSKFSLELFTKGANKGNAPKASDINDMIQRAKKEGE